MIVIQRLLLSLLLFVVIGNSSEDLPTQEEVAKLYVATFNRAPDSAGLIWWTNSSGFKLSEIAQSFFDQDETKKLYPDGTSNANFITSVYQNLFNRDPDTEGLDYWENELNIGSFSKNSFILAVINGAQNTDASNDADILTNKTKVGISFATAGLENADDAKDIMSVVTSDISSVNVAFSSVEDLKRFVHYKTSYKFQNTPDIIDIGIFLESLTIYGTSFDSRQYIDLDNDGVKEIVVATHTSMDEMTPVHIYKKQDDNYIDITSSMFNTIPTQVHPRKVISSDFNNDGLLDLYFIDHGYDHDPFPGAKNVLMVSDKDSGKLVEKNIPNNPTAFHHCGASGDIDNDNNIDIFVCTDAWQGEDKKPYFLLNDGKANMTVNREKVPQAISEDGMLAVELIDVDLDGFLDLIAGYRIYLDVDGSFEQVFKTSIFWGDGDSFSNDRMTDLPISNFFVATYDIKAEDIDGDGDKDIILSKITKDLTGYYFQIFMQTNKREFLDESLSRIIKDEDTWEGIDAPWFPWIHMSDINSDGYLDIVVGDSSANVPSRGLKWLGNSQGYFTKDN